MNHNCKPSIKIERDLPNLRLLLNKRPHQFYALLTLQHHNLHPSLLEILLPAHERPVLPNHHPRDLVQDTRPRAHVTRRQSRVHGRPGVRRRRQAARVLEC